MENKNLEPRMHIPKGKGMFYAYLYDTKEKVIIQKYYKGLNDPKKTFEEKLSDTEAMFDALKIQLKTGWIPKTKRSVLPKFETPKILISEALNLATESLKKRLAKKTVQCYEGTVRFFLEEVNNRKWQNAFFDQFEKYHIEQIFEQIAINRKWSNNEYNKNIVYIKAVFSELVRMHYLKKNPAHGIPAKKENERKPYATLTQQEQTTVINHFKIALPNFNIWLKTLYHTGIRPGELRKVKCSMVDINAGFFMLPKEITKTGHARKVPIPDDLKKDLLKFNLINPDYYLFGKHAERSRFNQNNFQPSQYILGTNAAGNIWKEQVIDKLGIKKNMYSNKHKKASDIISDGGSLEAVQRAFGHSAKITTEIYAQILEVIQLEEFKEKARDFE